MSVFRLHNPFSVLKKCLMSTFLLSYFLHFKHLECLRDRASVCWNPCGCPSSMSYLCLPRFVLIGLYP